ncbi:MAG: hypothetical protein IT373_36590 [Polyangiaceae bacterium]|nr:hypothetical protein [Polyangiaceae bacterium]
MESTVAASLKKLFDAERHARHLHDELASAPRGDVLAAVRAAVTEATGGKGEVLEPDEASLRLVCVARLLGEFEGPEVVDGLIDILASEHPDARSEAGEQLQGLAFDRFREVALGIERALGRLPQDSPALVELPYVLVEVPEGGVLKLLERFLALESADAVAAAIEACVEVGDPAAVRALRPLAEDERKTAIVDDEGVDEVTIGDLAADAIELLSGAGEDGAGEG